MLVVQISGLWIRLTLYVPVLQMIRVDAYIEFEKSEGEYERTRVLYERLLDRTKDLKVWISHAKFEAFYTKIPKELKRSRQIVSDDGLATGYEKQHDYHLFPEENLKIMESAYRWKKKQKICS
ncbi:hypothetical protein ACOSP7_027115 [Xanthoceras sorbifolium]